MIREKYNRIFLFDLETTGIDYKREKIIELGAIILQLNKTRNKYEIIEKIDVLVKIDFKLDKKIIELTNITDEMLEKEGVDEIEIYKLVSACLTDDTLIMGYNLQFDINFLNQMFRRYKNDFIIKQDLLDVMTIYKDRYPYPHRLKDAIEKFNIDLPNSHRALDDILATFEVFKKLLIENNNPIVYVNRFGYNPRYGVNGEKMPQVTYIPQYGGKKEIESISKKIA